MVQKLILGRPKIVVDVKCPKCKSLEIVGITQIEASCKNCQTKFGKSIGVNIYYAIAKKLIQMISHNNEVWIIGERDKSDVFTVDDLLKPRSKIEDDMFHTLLAIKHNFEAQQCYDVSEITNETDLDYKVKCSDCGFCSKCVICSKCNSAYVPKMIQTGEKRYTCPSCKGKSYKLAYVKFKISDGRRLCPHCKTEDVRLTRLDSSKRKCTRCGSENITSPRKIPVYKLTISRQRRFMLSE